MSIIPAPVTQYLLVDDFYNDLNGPVNPLIWNYPTGPAEYIPSTVSNWAGTETEPYLPSVSNGALQLTLQTYNPTSSPPGTSFLGSAIFSNQTFSTNYNNSIDNAGGILRSRQLPSLPLRSLEWMAGYLRTTSVARPTTTRLIRNH